MKAIQLQWSEERRPNDECSYTHVLCETPLGKITIEWKGWKDYDQPCCTMPWGEFVSGSTLDEAKANVQAAWDKKIAECADNARLRALLEGARLELENCAGTLAAFDLGDDCGETQRALAKEIEEALK